MKKIIFILLTISICFKGYSQINPDQIEIIRDNYLRKFGSKQPINT